MTAVINKKAKKLYIISRQMIENRITTAPFLFMAEPVSECLGFDLPFIQSVKEQIFTLRVEYDALKSSKEYKRSTNMVKKTKKLKEKIRRLSDYFIDSVMMTHPNGRHARRLTSGKTFKVPKTTSHLNGLASTMRVKNGLSTKGQRWSPAVRKVGFKCNHHANYNVYVSRKKRGKARGFKKVHCGPYYALNGLPSPVHGARNNPPNKPILNPVVSNTQGSRGKDNSKLLSPLSFCRKFSGSFRSQKSIRAPRKDPLQKKASYSWVILSKRQICLIPKNFHILNYGFKKPRRDDLLRPISTLGFLCSNGSCTPGWYKHKQNLIRSKDNIQSLSRKVWLYFAERRLGIPATKPRMPKGFKLIKS
jgi:hypothetical protein